MKTHARQQAGSTISPHDLRSVDGDLVTVPAESGLVHLQFRRFAGCPICSLHLQSVVRRHDEILAAGVQEVVVFHSSADDLRKFVEELPFPVVPDPDKVLYREFGVEASLRAFAKPSAWPPIYRGIVHAVRSVARGGQRPPVIARGGRHGLPCDLLIKADGTVLAVKYGAHADDQWSVDEVLALAAAHARTP